MPRYVAFLRAINTRGRTVKMDRLRSAFASLGLDDVETFIASGNVIFDSDGEDLTDRIEAALEAEVGFPIPVYARQERCSGSPTSICAEDLGLRPWRSPPSRWVPDSPAWHRREASDTSDRSHS